MKDEKNGNLFTKLGKMFSFNKNESTIFVPKELAEQIVVETKLKPESKPAPVQVVKHKGPGRPKKVFTQKPISLMSNVEKKSIFDLTDLSDVNLKLGLKVQDFNQMDFSEKLFYLFDIAKQNGMSSLTINQATAGYYNVFTAGQNHALRTKRQIANKLYALTFYKKRNYRNAYVVKVANTTNTYTMSDWK